MWRKNSAVDAELIFIQALYLAKEKWGTDANGVSYQVTARKVMDSLKGGVIESGNKKYLPFCMYAQGNQTRPCEQKVFLGYTNLRALKSMCAVDSFWCKVYSDSKDLLIGAVKEKGVYSAYAVDSNTYLYENADIHPNWVLKHLAEDGLSSTFESYYQEARKYFYEDTSICIEFQPKNGCIKSKAPPLRIYANYLEIAVARGDTVFAKDLLSYINKRRLSLAESPLASIDNYGNIVLLEAYADARTAGITI
ncbi:hypothetical protein M0R04_09830 [Candidatus Dojkabacteria bacterium]|jgi:hypothetical protein|nr:hypothetical protein [Candidatus Dojkabacteria bacterium]